MSLPLRQATPEDPVESDATDPAFAVIFGHTLRKLRKSAGLSLTGLEHVVHYSRGYLSKIENGRAGPNATLAAR